MSRTQSTAVSPVEGTHRRARWRFLVESYRSAKSAAAEEEADHAVVSSRGNYDVDGESTMAPSDALRAEEHRSALALADAALAQLDRPTLV